MSNETTSARVGVVTTHREVQLVMESEETGEFEVFASMDAEQARLMSKLLSVAADEVDQAPKMH